MLHAVRNKQPTGCEAQLDWICLFALHFLAGDFDPQNRSNHPVFGVYDQGALVGLYRQNYKSLCAAVTICATLVNNKQTAFWSDHMNRSGSCWAKDVYSTRHKFPLIAFGVQRSLAHSKQRTTWPVYNDVGQQRCRISVYNKTTSHFCAV